jgi:hypothetical protein
MQLLGILHKRQLATTLTKAPRYGDRLTVNCMGTKTSADLGKNSRENVAIVITLGSQLSIFSQNAHIHSVFLRALSARIN